MKPGKTPSLLLLMVFIVSTILTPPTTAIDVTTVPKPPVAKKELKITEVHGRKLQDEYFWLRDKSNPEVRAYLEAENAYTDAVTRPAEPLQARLYDEMLSRIKETDVQVPFKQGEYFYYSRTEKGKQYPIYCRKKGSLEAPEEITLDVNKLAEGQKFMSIGAYEVSDDGNLLAYSTDNTGFRQYTLHVKDLRTGDLLPDTAEKVGAVVWANDNQTLFYTIEDAAKRQYRLYKHLVGSAHAEDKLLYEETDERFTVDAEKTLSNKFILMLLRSHTTTEVRYIPADEPGAEWKTIEPRQANVEYYPDHHGDYFYIRVNDAGRNFRLVKAPVADPAKKNWVEVVPVRPNVMLEGVQTFKNFYVLREREDGLQQLKVVSFANGESKRIEFPETAYSVFPDNNREFDTTQYRFRYMSFITPMSVYDYDVATKSSKLLKQTEVLGGYDQSRYTVERVFATAPDGVKIPISLVYLKTLQKDGKAPIYLYAYGSYGVPMGVAFNSNRFSLVDRGFVFAIAHVRGGGDLGKGWHDDGRMMKKMNTFNDFIAAAECLTTPHRATSPAPEQTDKKKKREKRPSTETYGDRAKLVIEGGSAGGLLMGAVTNMRPDLFKIVVSKVPFVDVINSMLDESLPLTVGEFEEWGNPKNKDEFEYMIQYSPYDNLAAKAYPTMLVKTSFNDSQVMYWEPAKYVAKLRTLKTDKNLLVLKTNMGAGHGGASGRYDYLREVAFDYAFVLWQLGITQ
ncbi:MAG: S9 family peptidase [Terriglobales bacterium]